MKQPNPQIMCKDGTQVSVQASQFHYCIPRNDTGPYTKVEVGFPTVAPTQRLKDFAEDAEYLTETVYGYVPLDVVQEFLDEHGGIAEGCLPE
jgi:hypothetical protein